MERRDFIKKTSFAAGLSLLPTLPLFANDKDVKRITVLHTNDQHSRIEPFEKSTNAVTSDKGGFARRATLIHKIRQEEKNVLLLDAGDVFQGTPYFNMFGGELEYKLMTKLGYDAGTIGNHEYDNGLEGIQKALPHAGFDIISSNYDFSNTILDGKIKPYKIIYKDGIKIGIFAVGIELHGLVDPRMYKETKYYDPIEIAQHYTNKLRHEEKCDLVFCLSHIGYDYRGSNQVSDRILARKTKDIDFIIGGHTHTFLPEPEVLLNADNKPVIVNQVGWAGLYLGRVDFNFHKGKLKGYTSYKLDAMEINEFV